MISLHITNYVNKEKYRLFLKEVAKQASIDLNIKGKKDLNVVICDNDFIKTYNATYRKVDHETDVLSFPSDDENEVGDILISLPKAEEQAKEYGHSLKRELSFLMLHGILHCLGYDHETKEEEEVMFSLQDKILNECHIGRDL